MGSKSFLTGLRGYLTDCRNVTAIMCLSDTIAQLAIEKRSLQEWNIWRTLKFGSVGFVIIAPVLRKWYQTLEILVPKEKSQIKRGIKKMLYDQCLFVPPFTYVLTIVIPVVQGEKLDNVMKSVRENYFSILSKNYYLWPPAQIINFTIVPSKYQVTYVQFIALIWNSYLATVLN